MDGALENVQMDPLIGAQFSVVSVLVIPKYPKEALLLMLALAANLAVQHSRWSDANCVKMLEFSSPDLLEESFWRLS